MDRVHVSSLFFQKRYIDCLYKVDQRSINLLDSDDVAETQCVIKEYFTMLQLLELEKDKGMNRDLYTSISGIATAHLEKIKQAYQRMGGNIQDLDHELSKIEVKSFTSEKEYRDFISFLEVVPESVSSLPVFIDRMKKGIYKSDFATVFHWLNYDRVGSRGTQFNTDIAYTRCLLGVCLTFEKDKILAFSFPEDKASIPSRRDTIETLNTLFRASEKRVITEVLHFLLSKVEGFLTHQIFFRELIRQYPDVYECMRNCLTFKNINVFVISFYTDCSLSNLDFAKKMEYAQALEELIPQIKNFLRQQSKIKRKYQDLDNVKKIFKSYFLKYHEYISLGKTIRVLNDTIRAGTGTVFQVILFKFLEDDSMTAYLPLKKKFARSKNINFSFPSLFHRQRMMEELLVFLEKNIQWANEQMIFKVREFFAASPNNSNYRFFKCEDNNTREVARIFFENNSSIGKDHGFRVKVSMKGSGVIGYHFFKSKLIYTCYDLTKEQQGHKMLKSIFDGLLDCCKSHKDEAAILIKIETDHLKNEFGTSLQLEKKHTFTFLIEGKKVSISQDILSTYHCRFLEDGETFQYNPKTKNVISTKKISTQTMYKLYEAIYSFKLQKNSLKREKVMAILSQTLKYRKDHPAIFSPSTSHTGKIEQKDKDVILMKIWDAKREDLAATISFSAVADPIVKIEEDSYPEGLVLVYAEKMLTKAAEDNKRIRRSLQLISFLGDLPENSTVESGAVKAEEGEVHDTLSMKEYAFKRESENTISFSQEGELMAYLPVHANDCIEVYKDEKLQQPIEKAKDKRNAIKAIKASAPFYSLWKGKKIIFNQKEVLLEVALLETLQFYTNMVRNNEEREKQGKELFAKIEDLQSPGSDFSGVTQDFFYQLIPKVIDALRVMPDCHDKTVGIENIAYLFTKMYEIYLTPAMPILSIMSTLSESELGLTEETEENLDAIVIHATLAKYREQAEKSTFQYNALVLASNYHDIILAVDNSILRDLATESEEKVEELSSKSIGWYAKYIEDVFIRAYGEEAPEQIEIVTDKMGDRYESLEEKDRLFDKPPKEIEESRDLVLYLEKSEENMRAFVNACKILKSKAIATDVYTSQRHLARFIARSMIENDLSFIEKIRGTEFATTLGEKFDMKRACRTFKVYGELFSDIGIKVKLEAIAAMIEKGDGTFDDGTKGLNEIETKAFIQYLTGTTNIALSNMDMDEIEAAIESVLILEDEEEKRTILRKIYSARIANRRNTIKIKEKPGSTFVAQTCFNTLYLGNGAMSAADLRATIEVCIEGKGFTHA